MFSTGQVGDPTLSPSAGDNSVRTNFVFLFSTLPLSGCFTLAPEVVGTRKVLKPLSLEREIAWREITWRERLCGKRLCGERERAYVEIVEKLCGEREILWGELCGERDGEIV